MKKGKLLYKKFMMMKIYEKGIKPSFISYLIFDFIEYDRIIKIYPFFQSNGDKLTKYLFLYSPGGLTYKNYEPKIIDMGGRFTIHVGEKSYKEIMKILKDRIGNRFETVYDPNIGLKYRDSFIARFDLFDKKKGKLLKYE